MKVRTVGGMEKRRYLQALIHHQTQSNGPLQELIYRIRAPIGLLLWLPVATDRIVGLSLKAERGFSSSIGVLKMTVVDT